MGIDDVFEASIASGGRTASARSEELLLHLRVLDDGLDQEVGGHDLVDGRHAREDVVRVGPALLGELCEAALHCLERALDRARLRVVQRDVVCPEAATTCAIPAPICPAPTTSTCAKRIFTGGGHRGSLGSGPASSAPHVLRGAPRLGPRSAREVRPGHRASTA